MNATLPALLTMVGSIRDYNERTDHFFGYKPADGVSAAKDDLSYLILIKEDFGRC